MASVTVEILRATVVNGSVVNPGDIVEDVPEDVARLLFRTAKARPHGDDALIDGDPSTSSPPPGGGSGLTTENADAVVPAETATVKPQRKGGKAK